MPDNKYCYPNSDVLINKFGIKDSVKLFMAEKEETSIRLFDLQKNPIKGKFDFAHLKAIHKYIFQDIYEWAGKERTVDIGKGNLFCRPAFIQSYADSVFCKYFPQCYAAKGNFDDFVKVLAENYGDLNALHPFREGNGRAQREFARVVCLECGYEFNLSHTTHQQMLDASKLSFDKSDNSLFVKIFKDAVKQIDNLEATKDFKGLNIMTSDDLIITPETAHTQDSNAGKKQMSLSDYKKLISGERAARNTNAPAEPKLKQRNNDSRSER